ncbi:uncharacterized protein LOC105690564 isoform X2 [Athalia rosae]|uniref:uncharacterized protein LOC105690564 isoform X2 n=1 Tax=Athalia rosae TaxID=37344 RepID=UPI000625CC59|nr:uncharacterized protein LOC105690564 isoform X2 [Athalia rosae]
MGMSKITVWVLIRRYDRLESENDKLQATLEQVTLEPELTFDDLKMTLFCLVGIEDDGSKVLKIRRHDNNLIPFSALLDGSSEDKPFLVDVVRVHQYCSPKERSIPPGYVEALALKLNNLEKRVILVEKEVPELETLQIAAIEDAANQLSNCVSFLDRRLDELSPPHWKLQIGSGI